MKKVFSTILIALFLISTLSIVFGAEYGTKAEAEAMVKKAIAYIKEHGKEKAFAEISNPKGKFVDRDLYVTVYDFNGKCLAHGGNPKMVGKNMIDLKDPDGKPIVREKVELARTKDSFWQNYKFSNPVTKKIEQKSMYIERYGDLIVGCGAYKK